MDKIDGNISSKKNEEIKKTENTLEIKNKNLAGEIKPDDSVLERKSEYSEITVNVQRAIIKEQMVLAGLTALSSFIESGAQNEENSAFLSEIINKTQFDNEKVLEQYYQALQAAVSKNDISTINTLILTVQDRIKSLVTELEMNELKKQNLLSVQNLSGQENTEEQMRKILSSLKEEGPPAMNIPLKRIVDLLEE